MESRKDLLSDNFLPFYQPILSVEDQCILGHEVLARERYESGYRLPSVFRDDSPSYLTNQEAIESIILDKSFSHFANTQNGFLFINMSPDRLLQELEEHTGNKLPLVLLADKYSIPHGKIFIEITERSSLRELDSIGTAAEFYRELGFRIAMDDVGSESSNLERIGVIQPEIIKVDLTILKRSLQSRSFYSVLEYLKEISLGIGADLLYEGVETTDELNRAVDSGARFLQGYLLGMPNANFANPKQESKLLKEHLDFFHETKRTGILDEIQFEEMIRSKLNSLEITTKTIREMVHLDAQSVFSLSPRITRIYATDWEGTQITPYYERNSDNSFQESKSSLNKNWSYMPYFYKHIKQVFRNPKEWNTSEPYYDKILNKRILVFSRVLENHISVFVDVVLPDFA
jgi:EAL domain-containing protein (putative c-di-GMP-specific phosphodiesterase class I)